ncbi:MAG: 50S ribosomal protein L32 [Candidatus Poribacteria bacterium]|nr:50S ribosomal protein L32 [Candidatus Poribacteria bacterium]
MAHPKRKTSQSRTRTRRAHHALKPTKTILCLNCAQRMIPHRACPKCGYYKAHKWSRPVISVDID